MARVKKRPSPSSSPLPAFLSSQVRSNRESKQFEELYASHRASLSALLAEAPVGGKVAILGAGNALDLDGDCLGKQFDEVHFVDIDPASLEVARTRMAKTSAGSKLKLHGPVDVTGALLPRAMQASMQALQTGTGIFDSSQALEEVETQLLEAAATVLRVLPRFDVVLSDCVLTQTFCTLDAAWPKWAQYPPLRQSIVASHLQLLAYLLAPGGTGYFVTDVTTSDALPLEELMGSVPPDELLAMLAARNQFFGGLEPLVVQALLRSEAMVTPPLEHVSLTAPWLWRVLPTRSYLVVGHRFTRPRATTR